MTWPKTLNRNIKMFNYWTVISEVKKKGRYYSICKCKCGTIKEIDTKNLHNGKTTSCGCKRTEHDPKEAAVKYIMTVYRHRAKKNGISFSLDFKLFSDLVLGQCFYCGITGGCLFKDPSTHHSKDWREKKQIEYTGIDRLDSNIGYEEGNCITACLTCNKAKNIMTLKEFIIWVDRLNTRLVYVKNFAKSTQLQIPYNEEKEIEHTKQKDE